MSAHPPTQEVREAVARIIDRRAFKSWQQHYEFCLNNGDTEAEARDYANTAYGPDQKRAYAKADQIAALFSPPAGVVEALREALTPFAMFAVALHPEVTSIRTEIEADDVRRARQALSALEGLEISEADSQCGGAVARRLAGGGE